MTLASFEAALERTDELELTTTGRATGKPVSCPVWFVRRGEKLYLVPGDGTDSQWYWSLFYVCDDAHLPGRGRICQVTRPAGLLSEDGCLGSEVLPGVVHGPPQRVVGHVFPARLADRVVGSAGVLPVAGDSGRPGVPPVAGPGQ